MNNAFADGSSDSFYDHSRALNMSIRRHYPSLRYPPKPSWKEKAENEEHKTGRKKKQEKARSGVGERREKQQRESGRNLVRKNP